MVAALSVLALPASAASGAGTTSANFLELGVGARPVAMGQAFAGLADDANAIAYNPAGLAFLRKQELTLMHNELFHQVHHEWLAYAFPGGDMGSFAAAANILYVEPFAGYDEFDRPIGKTSAMDSAYQLAYARVLRDELSIGLGAKYLRSRLDDRSASTLALDAGLLCKPWEEFSFGVSVLNAGKGMRFVDETYPLPLTFKAGLAARPFADAWEGPDLALVADVTMPKQRPAYFSGGVEYVVYESLALRAGGTSGLGDGPGYSLGMGFLLRRGDDRRTQLSFDYAFVDQGQYADVHRAGITLRFGQRAFLSSRAPVAKLPAAAAPPKAAQAAKPSALEPLKSSPPRREADLLWINP